MKTVPLVYPGATMQSNGNNEGVATHIGLALQRAGYHVPHLAMGEQNLTEELTRVLGDREIEFVFLYSVLSLTVLGRGNPLWKFWRFRNTKFFVWLIDPAMYEVQSSLLEAFGAGEDQFVFGMYDAPAQSLFHEIARSRGHTIRTMPMAFGAPPIHRRMKPWNDRPFDITFCGNLGGRVRFEQAQAGIAEAFDGFRHGPAPFRRLVEAIDALVRNPAGALLPQLAQSLSITAEDLASNRWLPLVWAVDSYIKTWRRIHIVKQFRGRNLHLFGSGWERIAAEVPGLVLHGPRDWSMQDSMFENSKIVLNIEPNTDNAANDRAFWAPANGAVLLTQRNSYLDSALVHGDGYLGYPPSGDGILDVLNRTDAELEAIAASGSIKARAFHTWDHRIRDVVDLMRTVSSKADPIELDMPGAGARNGRTKVHDISAELFRLDKEENYAGLFFYVSNLQNKDEKVVLVLHELLAEGRFQAAFLVAKVLAGSGVQSDSEIQNATVYLARSVGGAIFGNADDEAGGLEALTQSLSQLEAKELETFRKSLAEPVFHRALSLKAIDENRDLLPKLIRIRQFAMPDFKEPETNSPKAKPKRTQKAK